MDSFPRYSRQEEWNGCTGLDYRQRNFGELKSPRIFCLRFLSLGPKVFWTEEDNDKREVQVMEKNKKVKDSDERRYYISQQRFNHFIKFLL